MTRPRIKPEELAFVEEYLTNGFDAEKAALTAGRADARHLLANPNVSAIIEERLKYKAMSAGRAVARMTEFATSNIMDFMNDNGTINMEAARARGYLIRKIKVRKIHNKDNEVVGEEHELELYDALAALDKVMRVLGLYKNASITLEDNRQVINNNLKLADCSVADLMELKRLLASATKPQTQEDITVDTTPSQ